MNLKEEEHDEKEKEGRKRIVERETQDFKNEKGKRDWLRNTETPIRIYNLGVSLVEIDWREFGTVST